MHNVLEKHGVMGIEKFITEPKMVQPPLSLFDEIACITQGLVPRIVFHDNHKGKIEALLKWKDEPEFQKGIMQGTNSKKAMEALNVAIGIHNMMQQSIDAQAQMQNVGGLQVSPTLGARTAGTVGETGRSLPQEQVNKGQVPQGQAAGGETGEQ
jgi:hypothetical protein